LYGNTIVFNGQGKSASFEILEKTQIITEQTEESEIVSTFAGNSGLQIKSKY